MPIPWSTVFTACVSKSERSTSTLEPSQFTAKVKVTPSEVKAYYDSHKQQFELPSQAGIRHLVSEALQG